MVCGGDAACGSARVALWAHCWRVLARIGGAKMHPREGEVARGAAAGARDDVATRKGPDPTTLEALIWKEREEALTNSLMPPPRSI
ncbi:hypothetical protein L7F22_045032 [Adiantum nelumboides]|nr:hypothetical protein [Adiantum nelumboides]